MRSLTIRKLPLRTLQYIETIKLASRLAGINLLEGHGKDALDVGCGTGEGLLALRYLGYNVYGFDIDLIRIQKAHKLGFTNVLQYDAQEGIPFNKHFHLITCFEILEHLPQPEKCLKHILSKLTDAIVTTTPNRHTELGHLNVMKPIELYNMIFRLLKTLKIEMQLKAFQNHILFSFHDRPFSFILPLLGSSTLIVLIRKH